MTGPIAAMIVVWLALAAFTGWLAGAKGRSEVSWFFFGLLFGLIALIAVGLAPPLNQGEAPDQESRVSRNAIAGIPVRDLPQGKSEGS
jgi:hypothetical protein